MVILTLQCTYSASPTQKNSESTQKQNALILNLFNAPNLIVPPNALK